MWELQAPGRAKEQDAFGLGGVLISRGLPLTRGEGRSACLWARLALFCRRINLCEINTSSCYFQVVLPAFRVQIHNGHLVNMCGMPIEEEARGVGGGVGRMRAEWGDWEAHLKRSRTHWRKDHLEQKADSAWFHFMYFLSLLSSSHSLLFDFLFFLVCDKEHSNWNEPHQSRVKTKAVYQLALLINIVPAA